MSDRDDDDMDLALENMAKLGFLCGRFRGTHRSWHEWGDEGTSSGASFEGSWTVGRFYLQEAIFPPNHVSFWAYDLNEKVYRKWTLASYGHFGRYLPDPILWTGEFDGSRLVMSAEQGVWGVSSEGKREYIALSDAQGMKFVYEAVEEGVFIRSQHVSNRNGWAKVETFPGFWKCSEVLFTREPSDGPAEAWTSGAPGHPAALIPAEPHRVSTDG